MCGRYSYTGNSNHVTTRLGIKTIPSQARYNIAPGQHAPVIRSVEGHPPMMDQLQWGLVPFWAKDPSIGFRTINARSEKAETTGSFRAPFRYRRCLVMADGFFEWKKIGRDKQPWRLLMSDESTFAMAGLWDHWTRPDGGVLETFTVLTTEANELVQEVHDRMPVILEPEAWAPWLSQKVNQPASVRPFLKPYPADKMKLYPVSDLVNRVSNDTAQCIEIAAVPPEQAELFSF
jgi:putative SOS response-associated peptidase YedK